VPPSSTSTPFNLNLSDSAEYWNRLYAAAIGRGIDSPKCSPALAARIVGEYQAWRDFYTTAVPAEHLGWTSEARRFYDRYEVLRVALEKEKIAVEAMPQSVIDKALNTAVALTDPDTIKAILAAAALVFVTPMIAAAVVRVWGATGQRR
jgi:hypothetical protein